MWSKRIGTAAAAVIGAGISYVGIRYLTGPAAMAPTFVGASAPRPDAANYLGNAKGIRDLFFGVATFGFLLAKQYRAAGWFLAMVSVVPVTDAVIVLTHDGSPAMALGVHATTAAATLASGLLILRAVARKQLPA